MTQKQNNFTKTIQNYMYAYVMALILAAWVQRPGLFLYTNVRLTSNFNTINVSIINEVEFTQNIGHFKSWNIFTFPAKTLKINKFL